MEALSRKLGARASSVHRRTVFLETAVSRDRHFTDHQSAMFFSPEKTAVESIRDNNAAWVAGPSRICFLRQASTFLMHPRVKAHRRVAHINLRPHFSGSVIPSGAAFQAERGISREVPMRYT
jgi:hypothetical protein